MPGFDDSELPDRPDRPALEATPERFRQLIDSQPDLIKHALALYSDVEAARDQMIDVADRDTR